MKTPAAPGRAQLPAAIGFSSGPNETAVTPSSPQARPGADAARALSVVSGAHCPAAADPAVGAASIVPSCSSARVRPDGPTAMAPGVSASPASSRPGVQFRPASVLVASGEKARFWLGRKPTTSEAPPPAATSPPLSATPCGVTSDQRPAVRGPDEELPEVVVRAAGPPMTATAQVPCAVTSEVVSGAVAGGGPVPVTLAGCDPQPAIRPAQARRQADPVRRVSPRTHDCLSAWRAYWLSSTENEDLVLAGAGARVGGSSPGGCARPGR